MEIIQRNKSVKSNREGIIYEKDWPNLKWKLGCPA